MNNYLFRCVSCTFEIVLTIDDNDFEDRMCLKCSRLIKRVKKTKKKLDLNQ